MDTVYRRQIIKIRIFLINNLILIIHLHKIQMTKLHKRNSKPF